jgi:hypothetical protein
MAQESNRKELERRLEQARRITAAAEVFDPITQERLRSYLEEQLREPG